MCYIGVFFHLNLGMVPEIFCTLCVHLIYKLTSLDPHLLLSLSKLDNLLGALKAHFNSKLFGAFRVYQVKESDIKPVADLHGQLSTTD